MRYRIHDKIYRYTYYFDTETGIYLRTGILDEKGRDTGVNPFMADFPHLIDIGIMGHCIHGKQGLCLLAGVECYQDGLHISRPNMKLEDFRWLIKQCRYKTNQVALGGRGDPDQHEHFKEILESCKQHGIVPNYTTSGLGMNDQIAALSSQYCGAVAVSWYRSDYTLQAIDTLLKHGNKTSIHYVLGNNSIDEAIERLSKDTFPPNIHALVFLLHKPKGLGSSGNVIKADDTRLKKLFSIIDNQQFRFQIGFDSCTVPGIINGCQNIRYESIEPCEGGRFSCYISSDMMMTTCSFDTVMRFGESLKDQTLHDVWQGIKFNQFRNVLRKRCPACTIRDECMGGCPLMEEIVLCKKREMEMRFE